MKLSAEDHFDLQNLMGRYCHLVDRGDPAWADLFTSDAQLEGMTEHPIIGTEALRELSISAFKQFGGFNRHHLTSVAIEGTDDHGATIVAYNLVSNWSKTGAGKLVMNAGYEIKATKSILGWRLSHVLIKVDQ